MSKAKLKIKYEGIQLKFGSKHHLTNANMTDAQAEELLNNHPRGKDLFDVLPDVKPKEDKDLKLVDLRIKYPDIKAASKKSFLEKLAASTGE